jgi:hypothetical protein
MSLSQLYGFIGRHCHGATWMPCYEQTDMGYRCKHIDSRIGKPCCTAPERIEPAIRAECEKEESK